MAGLEKALLALKLLAVNDRLKSVCFIGPAGSGKSTLLSLYPQLSNRSRITIPSHVTTDRLYGSVSLDDSIRQKKIVYEDGLFQKTNNVYFLVEHLTQFEEQIAHEIVKAIDQQFVQVVRQDVVEMCMPNTALYTLSEPICTLSENIRDCIGLSVTFTTASKEQRIAILKNQPLNIDQIQQELCQARERLPYVTIDEMMLQKIALKSVQASCFSLRADLYMVEAAKAHAALENRLIVIEQDIENVAPFILNHRTDQQYAPAPPNEPPQQQEPLPQQPPNNSNVPQQQIEDIMLDVDIAEHGAISLTADVFSNDKKTSSGKAAAQFTTIKKGRQIGTTSYKKYEPDIDFFATMKKAIPEQPLFENSDMAIIVKPHHFVNKKREYKKSQHFIFVVDASQSMHQNEQITAVKGVVLSLLKDAYQKRNVISLISMYKERAEVLLTMTKNIALARQTLNKLKVGGKTPLASGLELSRQVMITSNIPFSETKLILLTDGRANVTISGEQHVKQALQDSFAQAELIKHTGLQALVVDTEQGKVKLQKAQQLAKAMQANYISFSQFSTQKAYQFIRNGG